MPKFIITLQQISDLDNEETWGSLTALCDAHGFNYNSLKNKKFPFTVDGFRFRKSEHNTKTI